MPSSRAAGTRAQPQTQRLPAPQLFVGPPSRNDSNNSLIPQPNSGVSASRAPLMRQLSLRGDSGAGEKGEGGGAGGGAGGGGVGNRPLARQQTAQQAQVEQQSNERTDAIWAEMQNTLEEVELSAIHGTHVFRPGHSKALDDLRTAQIALAQAWARSEADDDFQDDAVKTESQRALGTSNVLAADRAEKLGGGVATGRPRSGTETSTKSRLEEDTENDILLARKRREANDRYFQRVNAGVLDVVAKLEEVAKAMKGVEQESKEIWGDGESIDAGSFTSR